LTDPAEFCSSAVELYEALSKPLVEVSLLSVKLALMMGPGPLCYCYSFFFAAGCWTRFAGPSIATMTTGVADARSAPTGPGDERSPPGASPPPYGRHLLTNLPLQTRREPGL